MNGSDKSVAQIVEENDWFLISDEATLTEICSEIVKNNLKFVRIVFNMLASLTKTRFISLKFVIAQSKSAMSVIFWKKVKIMHTRCDSE